VIIAAAGMLPWLYSSYHVYSHNWTPLLVPVVLTQREFDSPEFTTDLTGTYVASLVFEPTADDEKEDCQIGDELVKGRCNAIPRTLYLEWSVLAAGKQIRCQSHTSQMHFLPVPGS
jgi:hypothetical protein